MKIAVVPNVGQPHTLSWTKDLVEVADRLGVTVVSDRDAAGLIGVQQTGFDPDEGLDLVVAVGGDGTVLKAVRLSTGSGAPIHGINTGHLGYLTDSAPGEPTAFLKKAKTRRWQVSKRMTLSASINNGPAILALNDVVIVKLRNQRIVRLGVFIDDEDFISYPADGLVISTATGSTAYNLSAGGPLLDPELDMLVLTPVAPHLLFSRSMVFPPQRMIRVEVLEDRPVGVGVDGREIERLGPGDQIEVTGASHVEFARFSDRSFPASVKQKFSLA